MATANILNPMEVKLSLSTPARQKHSTRDSKNTVENEDKVRGEQLTNISTVYRTFQILLVKETKGFSAKLLRENFAFTDFSAQAKFV